MADTKKTGISVKVLPACSLSLLLSHLFIYSFLLRLLFIEPSPLLSQDLQPLSMTFDLPVSLVPQALPDPGSPLIQQVAQTLGVSVSFRAVPPQPQAQPAFYGSCCTVWGLQGHADAVKVSIKH